MSYTALYRKYRPTTFSEVVGQEVVVQILKNSIKNNKISHAYLFAGPRGTGKTSIAKIFARTVNCIDNKNGEFCGKCDICETLKNNDTDIIEIDAASNNGVDEIREIRNNVKLMPSVGKYKVYIIDEVHMLSTGAFNALLKTLEEPPAHVIFILATTEIHKIPLTILSRCLRFDFNKITDKQLQKRLKEICDKENVKFTDEILSIVAQISDGGCRDAINTLDQLISLEKKTISKEDVYNLNGIISREIILSLLDSIISNNYQNGLSIINKIIDEGKKISDLVNGLLTTIRDISINNVSNDYFKGEYKESLNKYIKITNQELKQITDLLTQLSTELKKSDNQKTIIEIYFIFLCNIFKKDKIEENVFVEKETLKKEVFIEQKQETPKTNDLNTNFDRINNIRINNVFAEANKTELLNIKNDYDKINDYLANKTYNNLANLLLDATPVVASNSIILFSFKKENMISTFSLNLEKIEKFVDKLFDRKYKCCAVTEKEWNKLKAEFVENKKNNIEYKIIDEEENIVLEEKETKKTGKIENVALDIFGEDTVNID